MLSRFYDNERSIFTVVLIVTHEQKFEPLWPCDFGNRQSAAVTFGQALWRQVLMQRLSVCSMENNLLRNEKKIIGLDSWNWLDEISLVNLTRLNIFVESTMWDWVSGFEAWNWRSRIDSWNWLYGIDSVGLALWNWFVELLQ